MPLSLDDVESKIDLKTVQSADDPSRGEHFKQTSMAVYDIIENKLYRDRNLNVENYFKTYWKISRAQAYRLYNCAVILKEMEGFAILPLRERYCRILKKLCKTPEERRELWSETLKLVDNVYIDVTSTLITSCWNRLQRIRGVPCETPSAPVSIDSSKISIGAGNQQQQTASVSAVAMNLLHSIPDELHKPNQGFTSTSPSPNPLHNLSLIASHMLPQNNNINNNTSNQLPPQMPQQQTVQVPLILGHRPPPAGVQTSPAGNFSQTRMMMQDYQRPRPYSVPAGIPSSLMRQQFLPNTQQNLSQQQHQQFFNNYQSPETPPAGFQHPTTFPFNPTNVSASYLDQRYKSHPYITATRYQQMMSSSNSVSNNDFNNNSNNNNFSTASATAINTTDNTTEVGPIRHSYGSSNARDGGYNQYSSAASVDPRLYFDDLIKPSSASGWQSEQTNNTITSTQSTAPLLLKKFESSSILPTPDSLPTSPNQQADSGVNVASGLLAETKINDGKRQQSSSTNDLKFILNASSSPISPQARGSESDYSSDVTI